MTEKKSKYIKVPTPAAILIVILLLATSFYSGISWSRNKAQNSGNNTNTAATTFEAKKTDKAELKFFVMSFCPYGNQMEDVLRPVYDLFKDKVNLTPKYIFEKISNLDTYCKSRSGDPAQCSVYVQNKYFTSEAECKKTISQNLAKCQDGSAYIKSEKGVMYASLHGRQEANQDVREICAWNLSSDKKQWWDFIGAVNKNCTAQNADSCWEDQAKTAGLDTNKITECFNKDGIKLIEEQIAETDKFNVSGSPTVLINDVAFPPESAYTQDGKGSLKIGNKVTTQDRYRMPNVIKEALCVSSKKAPSECKTILSDPSGSAPAAGGC
ncbi:hypothetical protein KBB48_00190 [Candidatus Shapirobacteria bacterium]|nr:hypothetical protein [Candidatus Shapirobacteria bacterium]